MNGFLKKLNSVFSYSFTMVFSSVYTTSGLLLHKIIETLTTDKTAKNFKSNIIHSCFYLFFECLSTTLQNKFVSIYYRQLYHFRENIHKNLPIKYSTEEVLSSLKKFIVYF